MRDILFRGKRVDNGEWIFGSLIIDERGNHYIGEYIRQRVESAYVCTKRGNGKTINRFIGIGFFMVIPETVGQYTGLLDKDGKKIFEGDIHERDGHYFVVKHGKFESFENSDSRYGWYFEAIKGDVTEEFYGDEEKYVNIIGNIHDNKDLLEVK